MKTIISMRAARTFAGPGMYAVDAEAQVRQEDQSIVYVHINAYDMFRHYTVSKTSIYDFMTNATEEDPEAEFEEEYSSLKETQASAYAKVFKALSSVISQIGKAIG